MSDDLYDRDFYAWTEAQAAALRARRSGDNTIDYDNLAEEIEDVGKSELRACESYVERIIEHLLKLEFVGPREATPGYKRELRAFRRNLDRTLTPSIARKLKAELPTLFAEVVGDLVAEEMFAGPEATASRPNGFSWDQVIDRDWYPPTHAD